MADESAIDQVLACWLTGVIDAEDAVSVLVAMRAETLWPGKPIPTELASVFKRAQAATARVTAELAGPSGEA